MLSAHTHHVAAGRPLGSFSAALVAVDPSFVNLTISAVGITSRNRSAHSSSIGDGRVKFVPSSSEARTAATTGA